jgi:FkbM family methyltransferase
MGRMHLGLGLRQRARELTSPTQRRNRSDDLSLHRLISWVVPVDGCCIDVGAHLGEFTLRMANVAPRGRHIAYEPLPEFAADLRIFAPNVDVREIALSDRAGEATFTHVRGRPGESGLNSAQMGDQLLVAVNTLDDDIPTDFAPILIKIDVEDHETEVLKGAARILADHHPTLAFEHGPGAQTLELLEFLGEYDYRVFDMDGNGPFTKEAMAGSDRWNWVAH